MFRSATFKLTLWYLAIAMAISLLFSVALYNVTTRELNRGLHQEASRIARQYPVFQSDLGLRQAPDLRAGSHHLLIQLALLNLLVLAGAGVSSYWLARRTLRPIEIAHEQQKRFTADVSHELRTPLTALRMESEVGLLNTAASTDELRTIITSNLEEVDTLEALINNLLRLSRLEADDLQQQFTAVAVADIVDDSINQLGKAAAARNITIQQSGIDGTVNGDHDSLVQLVVILLDNAIKYSPDGASVQIGSHQQGGQIVLTVSDHGSGIKGEHIKHIFDRFYRADDARTKNGSGGFGLGLSIAQLISDIHGGVITLSSAPGKGTKATVSLPVATPQ